MKNQTNLGSIAICLMLAMMACTKRVTETKIVPGAATPSSPSSPGSSGGSSDHDTNRSCLGGSCGGGGYKSENGDYLLKRASSELAREIRLSDKGLFSQLPTGWSQERLAVLIENVKSEPNNDAKRDGDDLIFNYAKDSSGKDYLLATQHFYTYAAGYNLDSMSEAEIAPILVKHKILLAHEAGHILGIGNTKDTNYLARAYAVTLIESIFSQGIACYANGSDVPSQWNPTRTSTQTGVMPGPAFLFGIQLVTGKGYFINWRDMDPEFIETWQGGVTESEIEKRYQIHTHSPVMNYLTSLDYREEQNINFPYYPQRGFPYVGISTTWDWTLKGSVTNHGQRVFQASRKNFDATEDVEVLRVQSENGELKGNLSFQYDVATNNKPLSSGSFGLNCLTTQLAPLPKPSAIKQYLDEKNDNIDYTDFYNPYYRKILNTLSSK